MGNHKVNDKGVEGIAFSLWAPKAKAVYLVGDFNGRVTYFFEAMDMGLVLKENSLDVDSEKLEEYIYHGSMVELRKTQKLLYVTFAVETEQDVYSYSISLDDLDGKYALRQFAQEIIDQLV